MLGMMSELDEFVDEALAEVSDWELNFKVLKAASRDAEKLPNEVKVGGHAFLQARTSVQPGDVSTTLPALHRRSTATRCRSCPSRPPSTST